MWATNTMQIASVVQGPLVPGLEQRQKAPEQPDRRATAKKAQTHRELDNVQDNKLPLPPQPPSPPQQPAVQPLTDDETKFIAHLRGLKQLGPRIHVAAPSTGRKRSPGKGLVARSLEQAAQGKKSEPGDKASLAHKWALGCLRERSAAGSECCREETTIIWSHRFVLVQRIQSLDGEWHKFVKDVVEKVHWHATIYHQHRAELPEGLQHFIWRGP
eukprot:Skav234744  [mRNA]  locus=scaffold14:529129:529882:- [translate_table: standard]